MPLKVNANNSFDGSLTNLITDKLSVKESFLEKHNMIKIFVIAKFQPMIMNSIYLKKSQTRFVSELNQNKLENVGESTDNDNEIMELIYMGKATFVVDP